MGEETESVFERGCLFDLGEGESVFDSDLVMGESMLYTCVHIYLICN